MKRTENITDGRGEMEPRVEEHKIRELLDLYFEGETTLADEEYLADFFLTGGDVPADLEYARGMFAAFDAARSYRAAGEMPCADKNPGNVPNVNLRMRFRRLYVSVSVAAAMLLAGGITWVLISEKPTVYCYLNGEPVTDISVAARQADMASRLLESNIRASSGAAEAVSRAAEPVQRLNRILGRINPDE